MRASWPELSRPGALCGAVVLLLAGCGGETASNGETANSGETTSSAPVAAAPAPAISPEEAGCDVDRANQVITQCKVCHSIQAGAENLTGPNLHGIVGRRAASRDGFAYSRVIRESGIVWSVETLDAFLANPLTYLPNNRMAFGGVRNDDDRAAVVCLLNTLR